MSNDDDHGGHGDRGHAAESEGVQLQREDAVGRHGDGPRVRQLRGATPVTYHHRPLRGRQ